MTHTIHIDKDRLLNGDPDAWVVIHPDGARTNHTTLRLHGLVTCERVSGSPSAVIFAEGVDVLE